MLRSNICRYLSQQKRIIGKFVLVSGSAVALNLVLLFVFVTYLGFESKLGQNIANALSMELSIIYNFFLSRAITWRDRRQQKGRRLLNQLVNFHLTIGVTILFRLGLFRILQQFGVQYLINSIVGIGISAVFNFVIYDLYVFSHEEL